MKLSFNFKLAVLLVALCAVPAVFALKPLRPPDEVVKLGENVVVIYNGTCARNQQEVRCLVGVHDTATYGLMLLFNNEGVLYQVIRLDPPTQETVMWTHPDWSI